MISGKTAIHKKPQQGVGRDFRSGSKGNSGVTGAPSQSDLIADIYEPSFSRSESQSGE